MSLEDARFLVLGAGGLGCPALLGLVAGGARTITLVDHDVVEATNLQRQVLFEMADVGAPKVEAAARRLHARARDLSVVGLRQRLDPAALAELIATSPPYTVILECTDDPELKFAANDACTARGLPVVIGAVQRWQGRVLAVASGAACYRCIFESPPPAELVPSCAAVGVIGAGAGTVGHLMATWALDLAEGSTRTAGRLIAFDFLAATVRTMQPAPRATCTCSAARLDQPA